MKNNGSTQDQFSSSGSTGSESDKTKAKSDRASANADLGSEAMASAEDMYHNAREALSTAADKLGDNYKVARERFMKAESEFEGMVKRNPLVAIGAAAGIGWAVGRYLSHSSQSSRRPS